MRVLVMIGIRSGCLHCSNALQIKRSTRPGTKEMAESTLLSLLDKEISATESNDPTRNECTNCHLVTRIDSHRSSRKARFLSHSHSSPCSWTLHAIGECKTLTVAGTSAHVFLPATHSPESIQGCLFLRLPHTTEEASSCCSSCCCIMHRSG